MAAGDFTNIRAESNAPDLVTIRYSYAGSGDVTLWRSTDDSTYAQVEGWIPSDYGSYPDLYDSTAAADTLYYYKLSDDEGSTKTAAVSVKTQKVFPIPSDPQNPALPVFSADEEVNAANVDDMRLKLQSTIDHELDFTQRVCPVCPVNGAVVLDCSEGCSRFVIRSDEITDINSISINCERAEVTFDVPEGTTTEICGFPVEVGSQGDECFEAPVTSPITVPLVITPPSPCQVTRIRYPAHPCAGEYTKDCFDKGSLSWGGGEKFNFSLPACGGSNSGCCSGNYTHTRISAGGGSAWIFSGIGGPDKSIYTFSGIDNREAKPTAGYSILFGRSGADSAGNLPWEGGSEFHTHPTSIIGKPIWGTCYNVEEESTVEDFTALVILMNHRTGKVIVGQYTNGNLKAGEMPGTIYDQQDLPSGIELIYLENFPSATSGIYQLYDDAGPAIYEFTDSGHAMSNDLIWGGGFFWVANPDPGTHGVRVIYDSGTFVQFWPS